MKLPEPRREVLSRSPLSLVVCQVRHERDASVSETDLALKVHEVVQDDYPVLEDQSTQELTITAGSSGVQSTPAQVLTGWRMRTKDQSWTAVLMPDFFSIETTRFSDWDDFRRRLNSFSRAVEEIYRPALEERVGLRFIDRMTHPEVARPRTWQGRIAPSFLGLIGDEKFADTVTGTQQVVQLDSDEGVGAIVRYGCVQEQTPSAQTVFLLDTDCYVQRGRAFSSDELLLVTETLHTLALQIFQAAITDEMFDYLRG